MDWYPQDNTLYRAVQGKALGDLLRYAAHLALREARDNLVSTITDPASHSEDVALAKDTLTDAKSMLAVVRTYLKMDNVPMGAIVKEAKDIVEGYLGVEQSWFDENHPPVVYSSPEAEATAKQIIASTKHDKVATAREGIAQEMLREDVMSMLRDAYDISMAGAAVIYRTAGR